jgi:hypothetical protein
MKSKLSNSKIFMGIFALLIITGCDDYTITTTLNEDGSCERIIQIETGSDSISKFSYPIPQDGKWTIETRKKENTKDKRTVYIVTAKKRFSSLEELANEYVSFEQSKKLRIRIKGERRFRWFYTYCRYSETYDISLPFKRLPIESFMTLDEVRRYQNGEKNDTLEHKANRWFERTIFEEFYSPIITAASALNDPQLTVKILETRKDEIFEFLFDKKNKVNTVDDIIKCFEKLLKNSAIRKLRDTIKISYQAIEDKLEQLPHGSDNYNNAVIMPGLILETNASELAGNKVTWRISSDRLKVGPLEMSVESRIVNTCAFIVTGVIVLFLIAGIVFFGIRARR